MSDSCDDKSLHAAGISGLGPRHYECNFIDVSGAAREIPPSEGGRDGTSLNVGNDIHGETPDQSGLGPQNEREVVRVNPLVEVFELRNSSAYVVQDKSYRIERAKIIGRHRYPTVPASRRRKVSLRKQSRRRVPTMKRPTSRKS